MILLIIPWFFNQSLCFLSRIFDHFTHLCVWTLQLQATGLCVCAGTWILGWGYPEPLGCVEMLLCHLCTSDPPDLLQLKSVCVCKGFIFMTTFVTGGSNLGIQQKVARWSLAFTFVWQKMLFLLQVLQLQSRKGRITLFFLLLSGDRDLKYREKSAWGRKKYSVSWLRVWGANAPFPFPVKRCNEKGRWRNSRAQNCVLLCLCFGSFGKLESLHRKVGVTVKNYL